MADAAPAVPAAKDVRGPGVDHKRDHDHKGKWHRNWTYGILASDPTREVNGKPRPAKPGPAKNPRPWRGAGKEHRRRTMLHQQEVGRAGSDDDDVAVESEPDLDTEAAFDGTPQSFDSTKGPTAGQELLGIAMSKAVARWEDKKTTALIKDEYDVLDAADRDHDVVSKQVEDDFELL